MSQRDFLESVITLLTRNGIPFMVAGSMGSAHYGEPRSTNDIDIVIDPTEEQLQQFVSQVSERFYVSPPSAMDALKRRSMFNIIDTATGWKADLIIRKDRPFSITEFDRRTTATLLGVAVDLATPEDVVLSKLEWAARSESERQLRDARSVLETMAERIDFDYLKKWAGELGLQDLLDQILPE